MVVLFSRVPQGWIQGGSQRELLIPLQNFLAYQDRDTLIEQPL